MPTKFELEKNAKALIDSDPSEAVIQYRKIWDEFGDKFNEWDAFYSIKALRKVSKPDLRWAEELVDRFNNEKVNGLYAWLVFDTCIKGRTRNDILRFENLIAALPAVSPQKNLQADNSFPCPTSISIFKLVDALTENQFNAPRVNELLESLNHRYLSIKTSTITTEERGSIELASDLEKYYALKTKALLKLGEHSICKSLCEEALSTIAKFHYDNDTWFRMRIAICDEKLGNLEASETQFKSLLATRTGSDKWFIYRDIADFYLDQGDLEKAWKYAVDATSHSNEPHYMIGLYHLQAKILYKLDRADEGKILAELIASVIKEQQWRTKDIYAKLISFYEVDTEALKSSSDYLKAAQAFWMSERYAGQSKIKGEIVSINNNGKGGKIRDEQGRTIGFHRKDFVRRPRDLSELVGASAEFYIMPSFEGKPIAENILVAKTNRIEVRNDMVGKRFTGIVKSIVDFGIFVGIDGHSDALLHKNNIPKDMRTDLNTAFKKGDSINVEVTAITEKGMQLKYVSSTTARKD